MLRNFKNPEKVRKGPIWPISSGFFLSAIQGVTDRIISLFIADYGQDWPVFFLPITLASPDIQQKPRRSEISCQFRLYTIADDRFRKAGQRIAGAVLSRDTVAGRPPVKVDAGRYE